MTLINNDVRATFFFPLKQCHIINLLKNNCAEKKKKAKKRLKIYTITVQIKKKNQAILDGPWL